MIRTRVATLFGTVALLSIAPVVVSAVQAAATSTMTEAETLAATPSGRATVIDDTTASNGKALAFWGNGTVSATVSTPITRVALRARGQECDGPPVVRVTVDGVLAGAPNAVTEGWQWMWFSLAKPVGTAKHTITVSYANDRYVPPSCDRNLAIDAIATNGDTATAAVVAPTLPAAPAEAESLVRLPVPSGADYDEATASGGRAELMWSTGSLTYKTNAAISTITTRVKGDQCAGAPQLQLTVDGVAYPAVDVYWPTWATYQLRLTKPLPAGAHTVIANYVNNEDGSITSCDRNLRMDWIGADVASTLLTTAPARTSAVTMFYRNPDSLAARAAAGARTAGKIADANLLDKIAGQPTAIWLGDYVDEDILLDKSLANAAAEKTRVVFALYAIPDRDSGQYAAAGGGAQSPAEYRAWIDHVAQQDRQQAQPHRARTRCDRSGRREPDPPGRAVRTPELRDHSARRSLGHEGLHRRRQLRLGLEAG